MPSHWRSAVKLRMIAGALWLLVLPPIATALAGPPLAATTLAGAASAAAAEAPPYSIEHFTLPGPIVGVVARVVLTDPRVSVDISLADPHDPDGAGPMTGRLATPSDVARRQDYTLTMNAGYFSVAQSALLDEKRTDYFSGNGAVPVGWHFSNNKLVAQPSAAGLRATMVVRQGGTVTLMDDVQQLPVDTRFAVSGSAMVLAYGVVNPPAGDYAQHPRSAVGISEDGRMLMLMAIDGRQEGYSRGMSLGELATVMREHGAFHAINLDGGGSTALVLKDAGDGSFRLLNRPSDRGARDAATPVERPVADVIGVRIAH